ncbi:hypothetical protein BGZ83_000514, partial [Gryganskiella cystojenkinii]
KALSFGNSFIGGLDLNLFCDHFRSRLWHHLENLIMTQLTDSQAKQILDACLMLKKVDLMHSGVSYEFLWAIERHSTSLEHLNLAHGADMKSWMPQRLLTSCPNLTFFAATSIDAWEMVVGLGADECRQESYQAEFVNVGVMTSGFGIEAATTLPINYDLAAARVYFAKRDPTKVLPWVSLGLRSLSISIQNVREDTFWATDLWPTKSFGS